jgi:TPR repeat protein
MAECELAAEQGQLMAQLTLAQLLWNRKATSEDMVQSYKWYLIASDQVLQASKHVSRAMTMEQLLRAEHMAADWLKNTENSRFFGQGDHGRFGRKQEGPASD